VCIVDAHSQLDRRRAAALVRRARLRGGPLGELVLALPPTLTVIAALFFVEALTSQRVLFASLASSAFLIYREPTHSMNSLRVMAGAHLAASVLGVGCAFLLGAGYRAAAVAMVMTIIVLVLGDLVHPPAVATALGFAFYARQAEVVGVFVLAVLMVVILVVLERVAVWTLVRVETNSGPADARRAPPSDEQVGW
jgi:CBS-domain-containing membrane protein